MESGNLIQTMLKLKNNNLKAANFRNKLLWPFLVYMVFTGFTIFLVVSLWNRFLANPTLTSLESSVYSVGNIPFPGVSLCNLNKISKKRAQEMAEYIVKQTGQNFTRIMSSFKFLGFLHDSNYDIRFKTEIEEFQSILDSLQLKITALIRNLTTPCDDLLQMCRWKGHKINCSNIFRLRLTFEGYCCVFNYVKNTSEWWMRRARDETLVLEYGSPGISNGLSVELNIDIDDYFYTMMSSTGVNVHIFIPSDYPDKSSGDLIENIADIGTENFVEIIPTTVRAVRDVMNYAVDKRECLFEVEQRTQFGVYSQSDCFVDCRVKSMTTLCECIPFTVPLSDDYTVCTLRDLPCLARYKSKWSSLVPDKWHEYNIRELEDALLCSKTCYPSCDSTLYRVGASAVQINDSRFSNITAIHIFYRDRHHSLYKQDVVYYWFEILSNYGGVFGISLGVSLISIIECLLYSFKVIIGKYTL
ncbi:sodium channel protein Nach [Tribolium castaneum]|uniref:sodium channel protein Nach n=1 Tax=Tribolium castaneum TaxID=7070 RepID=UPI00077DB3D2|nr:PREDICTED: sodium channel protein Nach [Tribolium castaneum]|eukprot:XP_015837285.1 PREDICTED: sodium channel protein Nach [Tribolium castaneum]